MAKGNKYLEKLEEEASLLENKAVAEIKKELVDFDAWFAARASKIPVQHYKEIIMADMKARGVAMMNEMHKFDEALAKYGIKLK